MTTFSLVPKYIYFWLYIYSQHENIITAVVNWNTTSKYNARKC